MVKSGLGRVRSSPRPVLVYSTIFLSFYRHWSTLNGDDELTWGPDPLLTPLGQSQAEDAKKAWKDELSHGIPLPEKCYGSPLKRALDTWALTLGGSGEDEVISGDRRRVTILEVSRFRALTRQCSLIQFQLQNCREEYGIHTCDLRSTLSALHAIYPSPTYNFESDFAEEDPVWRKDERETKSHIAERARSVLDIIFRDFATGEYSLRHR